MPLTEQTNDLIAQIYDAALDATQWPHVLSTICSVLKGTKAVLGDLVFARDPNGQPTVAVGSNTSQVGRNESLLSIYTSYYAKLDPILPSVLSSNTGEVTTASSVGKRAELERSEFFVDYARPYELYDNAYVPLLRSPQTTWLLSVARPTGVSVFTNDERQQLASVGRHLQRALQIRVRLAVAEAQLRSAVGAIPQETLLVDASCRVVYADPNANVRLIREDGLSLAAGTSQLVTRTQRETNLLRKLVAQAANPWRYASPGGYMCITRGVCKPALTAFVAPMQRASVWPGVTSATAMILLSDPEQSPTPPRKVLQQLYGLTPAESRVAELLLDNRTLHEVADLHDVTVSTVRSQLKQVFEKTQTHRQSELVRLLMRLPAISGAEPPAEVAH